MAAATRIPFGVVAVGYSTAPEPLDGWYTVDRYQRDEWRDPRECRIPGPNMEGGGDEVKVHPDEVCRQDTVHSKLSWGRLPRDEPLQRSPTEE